MLDKYNRLPYNIQSKVGYDASIQIGNLKQILNTMATTITDMDMEVKMKISRIEYLESKKTHKFSKASGNHLYSKSGDVDSLNLLVNLRQSIDFGC